MVEKPIGAPLNRDLTRDIAPGEDVEWQLDALISQRDKQRREEEGNRPEEAAFREGERRAAKRRAEENRATWIANQKHLRGVYLALYYQKDRIIKQLEGGM